MDRERQYAIIIVLLILSFISHMLTMEVCDCNCKYKNNNSNTNKVNNTNESFYISPYDESYTKADTETEENLSTWAHGHLKTYEISAGKMLEDQPNEHILDYYDRKSPPIKYMYDSQSMRFIH